MCSLGEVRRGGRPPPTPHRCLFWCCCCNCSWAKCLAAKGGSENGPTKKPRDPSPCDPLIGDSDPPPTMEEILAWGKSFDKLMRSAAGRKVFRDFLRGEYSEENIMFWLACEELKKEADPDAVEEKARFIYEDYISILSPKEVSLDSHVREIVNRNMVQPTPHTFDEAQLQIYTLMHRDSYPRFVNSTLYKTLAQISASSPAQEKSRSECRLGEEERKNIDKSIIKIESQCKHVSETERVKIETKEISVIDKLDETKNAALVKESNKQDDVIKEVATEELVCVTEKVKVDDVRKETLEKPAIQDAVKMDVVRGDQESISDSKSPKNAKLSPKT